jgi:hypothetical protein
VTVEHDGSGHAHDNPPGRGSMPRPVRPRAPLGCPRP